MKLYQAVDKLDNKESFFLMYPDQSVAVMSVTDVETVKRNAKRYRTDPSLRFDDAINPVLIEEWWPMKITDKLAFEDAQIKARLAVYSIGLVAPVAYWCAAMQALKSAYGVK